MTKSARTIVAAIALAICSLFVASAAHASTGSPSRPGANGHGVGQPVAPNPGVKPIGTNPGPGVLAPNHTGPTWQVSYHGPATPKPCPTKHPTHSPTGTPTSTPTGTPTGTPTSTPTQPTGTVTGGVPVVSTSSTTSIAPKPFRGSLVVKTKTLPRTGGFYSFGLKIGLAAVIGGIVAYFVVGRQPKRQH